MILHSSGEARPQLLLAAKGRHLEIRSPVAPSEIDGTVRFIVMGGDEVCEYKFAQG